MRVSPVSTCSVVKSSIIADNAFRAMRVPRLQLPKKTRAALSGRTGMNEDRWYYFGCSFSAAELMQ
jgi:hypothetical protein